MKDLSEARRIVEQQRGEIESLKAKLAEAEKDAGRYRAVRSGAAYIEPHPGGEIYVATDRGLYCKTASEVDALIDAAIERQGGQVE
jgi:hypothetical protein